MKKRRHHYIWRYYLKPWTGNGKIWCCRKGKKFNTNLINVGQIKDFYRLKKLSKKDIEIIHKLTIENTRTHLQKVNKRWIEVFNFIFELKKLVDHKDINDEKINEFIDIVISNLEENIHSKIERDAKKYLDLILNENIDFYKTEEGCVEFSYFISVQYSRTNKVKSSVLEKLNGVIDIENAWNVLAHIFASNISWGLFENRQIYAMVLLKNETSEEFITGDQPVINTCATYLSSDEPPEELELYYPVSPNLAILITERENDEYKDKLLLSREQVIQYNKMIAKQAHTQLYASSEECFKKYSI